MGKTGQQIEQDIFALLQGSAAAQSLSGAVYLEGTRPADSTLEDAVVRFTGSADGQIQQGSAEIEIYIPDRNDAPGGSRKNVERCAQVEESAQSWVDALRAGRSEYHFSLAETIRTRRDETRPQHGVLIKLNFKRPSF